MGRALRRPRLRRRRDPRIPLNLILLKGIRLLGFENRTILDHIPATAAAHRIEVLQLFLDGAVSPHVGAVYPLSEIGSALSELAERRAVGKVVVSILGVAVT